MHHQSKANGVTVLCLWQRWSTSAPAACPRRSCSTCCVTPVSTRKCTLTPTTGWAPATTCTPVTTRWTTSSCCCRYVVVSQHARIPPSSSLSCTRCSSVGLTRFILSRQQQDQCGTQLHWPGAGRCLKAVCCCHVFRVEWRWRSGRSGSSLRMGPSRTTGCLLWHCHLQVRPRTAASTGTYTELKDLFPCCVVLVADDVLMWQCISLRCRRSVTLPGIPLTPQTPPARPAIVPTTQSELSRTCSSYGSVPLSPAHSFIGCLVRTSLKISFTQVATD